MKEIFLDSIDIASFIVKHCAVSNYFINLTKLQKILYCCYGVMLAAFDERICTEHPKAWPHGPVFPRVYNVTSKNRDGFVQYLLEYKDQCSSLLSDDERSLLKKVIDAYAKYPAGKLVEWTHLPDSPWSYTVKNTGMHSSLDDSVIKSYFEKRLIKHASDK